MSTYAVIMAGGSGTRLWPLSRAQNPKFLLPFRKKQSLLGLTVTRFAGIVSRSEIRIVCGEDHVSPIRKSVLRLTSKNFIVEPAARNTAPCVGLAAVKILEEDPEALLIMAPADHFIGNVPAYQKALRQALAFAKDHQALVALGIVPTKPHTGYGYIERSDTLPSPGIFKAARFVEKPIRAQAEQYLKTGRYYWNAGIFVGRASVFLEEIHRWMPELGHGLKKIKSGKNFQQSLRRIYPTLSHQSIDVGVMEKSQRVHVMPVSFDWHDVGDLVEFTRLVDSSASLTLSLDSSDLTIYRHRDGGERGRRHQLIVFLGVKNLIVAETDDALLIADAHRAQDVKKVPQTLLKKKALKHYV